MSENRLVKSNTKAAKINSAPIRKEGVKLGLKEKLGFICIGQAGGNIGQLLEQSGFDCLFINTSTEDLSTLETKYRYHIPGGEGCNHNRDKAIALVKQNYQDILAEIEDKLPDKKMLMFVFSAGGGTGSGSAPILIDMVNGRMADIGVGCVCILPALDEPVKAHINAVKCYGQLTRIDKLGAVFTLDNEKDDKFSVNKTFVDLISLMVNMPQNVDTRGNIDNAELMEVLTTRGGAFLSAVSTQTTKEISSQIIKSWEKSIFADIEKDKQIVYMALSLMNDINTDDLRNYIGTPLDIFKNYNKLMNISVLSGLSFPNARLDKSLKIVEKSSESIKNSVKNARSNRIEMDFGDDLEKLLDDKGTTKKRDHALDIDAILKNY